jgi:hypothetical protein
MEERYGSDCRKRLWHRKGAASGPLRALAPPSPLRLPEEVFEKKTSSGKVVAMRIIKCLKVAGGSLFLATVIYVMLAAPGLLTDTASTVPLNGPAVGVHP